MLAHADGWPDGHAAAGDGFADDGSTKHPLADIDVGERICDLKGASLPQMTSQVTRAVVSRQLFYLTGCARVSVTVRIIEVFESWGKPRPVQETLARSCE